MMRISVLSAVCLVLCLTQAGRGAEGEDPKGWLQDLESPDFAVREQAGGNLAKWAGDRPDKARQLFLGHLRSHEDPEVRMRCRELLRASVLSEHRRRGKGFVGIMMQEIGVEGGALACGSAWCSRIPRQPKPGSRLGM